MEPFSTAKGVWNVIRELSLDEIRDQALTPPSVLILSDQRDMAERIAANVTGLEYSGYGTIRRLDEGNLPVEGFDAVIIYGPESSAESKVLLDRIRSSDNKIGAAPFLSTDPADPHALSQVRARIVTGNPDRAVALGRFLPAFRTAAFKQVNDETSMANAQFSLISNVPTVVPLLGSIATVGADFFILTKNQLLLIFKIAAIHGEDLHDSQRIFREMVPVVGAGFFWRTVAREAAALVPFMGGAVPKVAIAYTGTMAIGKAADYYYAEGTKPSKETMKGFYQQAMESLSRRQFLLKRNPKETETKFRLIEEQELIDD
ncbi:MAG: hypothetical protein E6R14_03055 [Thermomicrobiales bacterium]|nr:MAG: hypothetical protein E6R14_03055 [Thermomicrobiales bacterium]